MQLPVSLPIGLHTVDKNSPEAQVTHITVGLWVGVTLGAEVEIVGVMDGVLVVVVGELVAILLEGHVADETWTKST